MLRSQNSDRVSVQLEFDSQDSDNQTVFEVGDSISGTAVVTAHQDTVCNKIILQLRWETHGKGNRTREKYHPIEIHAANNKLIANETQRIPFSFQTPKGPISYRGTYLNIDWYLKVIIDARGPFDPSTEGDFILLPKKLTTAYVNNYLPTNHNHKPIVLKDTNNPNRELYTAIVLLGGVLFAAIVFLLVNNQYRYSYTYSIFPIAAVLYFFRKTIRNAFSRQKLGTVNFSLAHTRVLPDDSLNCTLKFKPIRDAKINTITFKLQGDERVVSGNGSNKRTHTNTIFEETVFQSGGMMVMASETVELEQSLKLPPNAAYSFSAPHNYIEWSCHAIIDIEGWPNWVETLNFEVVPW